MADLIYTTNVSVDGFIEDDGGGIDFTNPDDDVFTFITTSSGRRAPTSTADACPNDDGCLGQTPTRCGVEAHRRVPGMRRARQGRLLRDARTPRTRPTPSDAWMPDAIRAMKASERGHLTIGGADLAGQAFRAGPHRRVPACSCTPSSSAAASLPYREACGSTSS